MGVLFDGCPGAAFIRGTPTIKEKICPECGEIIEIFSVDVRVQCECGFIAYNEVINCISWCKYARECVGDEVYERLAKKEKNKEEKQ